MQINHPSSSKGFSLIEILVAVAIIASLSAAFILASRILLPQQITLKRYLIANTLAQAQANCLAGQVQNDFSISSSAAVIHCQDILANSGAYSFSTNEITSGSGSLSTLREIKVAVAYNSGTPLTKIYTLVGS